MIEISVATADEGTWMTPDFTVGGIDNAARPEKEQARVKILPLSGREKLRMDHDVVLKTKVKRGKDFLSDVSHREWLKQKKILETRVVGLQGWSHKGQEITDPKVWVETMLNASAVFLAVLDQVYGAILDISTLEASVEGE